MAPGKRAREEVLAPEWRVLHGTKQGEPIVISVNSSDVTRNTDYSSVFAMRLRVQKDCSVVQCLDKMRNCKTLVSMMMRNDAKFEYDNDLPDAEDAVWMIASELYPLFWSARNLQSLTIKGINFAKFDVNFPPTLKHIHIGNCMLYSGSNGVFASPYLEKIEFESVAPFDPEIELPMINNLKKLVIKNCDIDDKVTFTPLSLCNMEELHIDCDFGGDSSFHLMLLSGCLKLHTLTLKRFNEINGISFLEDLPRLKKVDFKGSDLSVLTIHDRMPGYQLVNPSIKELVLDYCTLDDTKGLFLFDKLELDKVSRISVRDTKGSRL